ncbi:Ionotropic glutamate receptor, L-glutamate and glycine-binding domain,Ionotropic glutamate receptor [Cinara cedri]|uniref:Ionotropic glutamate receptor, L-glutamate and glycine-binding domain,Ionotropic glutamate receptor n=1 Tax=Cinara cedri TaxID=506608 RepID=A0A5E4NBS5_9HEMI|nr:Ionotropic glutamate receptor, L-glutamate and glycine-binding domain,Ionotropic glutamate receptor [Cinara cedri]
MRMKQTKYRFLFCKNEEMNEFLTTNNKAGLWNEFLYSPNDFNFKDVILISVHPQKETVYQMSIYHEKFVVLSKQQDQWFGHDLEGKKNVKNFHKTRVKLIAYNNTLFSSVINNSETGKLSLANGVECSLFKEIAKRINITWDVYTSNDEDKWGTAHLNNTVTGGALKWLFMKRADVAFCSLWIEDTRLKFIDMSRFWTLMCLKFLVPKPQPLREKWDLLFKPFPLSLWLLVLFSASLTIITVRIMADVQKQIGYEQINAFTSLSSTIFWIVGMMLLTNNPRTNRMGPIRHLINWWCIFMFIMSTSFSSILYSYITSPEYTNIVLEIEDMVKANYHWGLTYPPPFDFIFQMQNPVHRAFIENFVPERNIDDRVDRLKRGQYATLAKCLYEKHFMETENVPAAILNDLRTARTCMNQLYIGFGFVKHSPYVKSANLVIQRIFEGGLIEYWLSRVTEARMSPATFKQVYEIKPHRNGGNRPSALSYKQFKVVMVVWIIGCVTSTIVFAVECQCTSRDRN